MPKNSKIRNTINIILIVAIFYWALKAYIKGYVKIEFHFPQYYFLDAGGELVFQMFLLAVGYLFGKSLGSHETRED